MALLKRTFIQNTNNASSRIPLNLQNVIISSNRGNEVIKPPPGNVASKCFGNFSNVDEKKDVISDSESVISAMSVTSVDTFMSPPEVISLDHELNIRKSELSPQQYLEDILCSRGYSKRKLQALQSGYYARPTPLQQASHGVYLNQLVRDGDHVKLQSILEMGISPNPCNAYGESTIHLISRRCKPKMLETFLNAGASVQVSDDYGRTPLHDACWRAEPCFEIIELIANEDINMFQLQDARGYTPLDYISKNHWDAWIKFIDSKSDVWWTCDKKISQFVNSKPNSHPLADPENALNLQLANMLTSGRMTLKEVKMLVGNDIVEDCQDIKGIDFSDDDGCSSDYSDDDFTDYDDDFYSDSNDCDLSEQDLNEIFGRLSSARV